MYKLLGDDMHKEFINMLNNARKKANYYISRDTEKMNKQDLYDFYTIGELYRNEFDQEVIMKYASKERKG